MSFQLNDCLRALVAKISVDKILYYYKICIYK